MFLKGRGPVEHLNRDRKYRMIEAFLEDATKIPLKGLQILDIGCGNGQISNNLGQNNTVFGVDVEDKRTKKNLNFKFALIKDEILPFGDNFFDVVVSHHVIEHVKDQTKHLSEIHRVLKDNGVVYLGCPNKSSPFMAGHVGNKSVLNQKEVIELFTTTNFVWEEYYTRLLTYPDKYHCEINIGKFLPSSVVKLLRHWYPSYCFILRKKNIITL